MHEPLPQSVVVRARDGETMTDRPSRTVRILVAGDEALTMTWTRYVQGERGPELHVHHEHSDAFYVLSGTLSFKLGADGEHDVVAPAGSVVVAPPDVPHAFRNDGPDEVTFLNIHTPDTGFAKYMHALRDGGETAWFDQHTPPPTGNRPAEDAIIVPPGAGDPGPDPATLVRYVGEDLVVTEEAGRLTLSIPWSAGPDVVYLLSD
jgi:mannose-6-phosphate isomerase-like protein (cupin superfamily)